MGAMKETESHQGEHGLSKQLAGELEVTSAHIVLPPGSYAVHTDCMVPHHSELLAEWQAQQQPYHHGVLFKLPEA